MDIVEKPKINALNFSHLAIARWLVENPDKKLGECAAFFGYSQSWLSIIIHSDAFKAAYDKLQKDADAIVLQDTPAKLRGMLHSALDGLSDQIDMAVEDGSVGQRDFLLETSDKILARLGYGPQKGAVHINTSGAPAQVNIGVDASDINRARARLVDSRANEARVINPDDASSPA